jgi:imidazolonepropionase-like amidohydrolase
MKRADWIRSAWMAIAATTLFGTQALAETLVVDGATVHTMTGEPFVGRVVMVDGIIVDVGPGATVPAGATRIDAAGLHVYPGICDALSTLGLIEIDAVSATNDQAEMGMYNPHLRAATAIHPSSEVIPVARANGITHAVVAPRAARDGVIAGQAALVNLAGWTVEEMAIDGSVAMVINWPAIVTRRFDFTTFEFKDTPYNDAKEEAQKKQNELRDWVEAARQYRQAMAVERPRAEVDQKLAALARCLDGGVPVIIQADAKRDIEDAIAFAGEYGFRMILAGGRDAWKIKDTLAGKDIPVILSRPQSLPREEDDPYDLPFTSAGVLREAGVRVAFASGAGGGYEPGGPHASRTLPYEAATSAAYGLSPDDAMKAITLWPAEILGVGGRLGSIEKGKIANLIVTDGSPLEIMTTVQHVIIGGREVPTDNMQRDLYEKYRSRPLPQADAEGTH